MSWLDKLKGIGSTIYHGVTSGGGAPGGPGSTMGHGGVPVPGITDPYFKGVGGPAMTGPSLAGGAPGGVALDKSTGTPPTGGSGAWNWVGKNLPTIATGLGIGASIYGARQAGAAEDKALAQNASQFQQSYGLNERQTALNEKELQSRLDADQAEKSRRQQALIQILGMGRQAATMPPPAGG